MHYKIQELNLEPIDLILNISVDFSNFIVFNILSCQSTFIVLQNNSYKMIFVALNLLTNFK